MIALADAAEQPLDAVGAKARTLARALAARFPVPDGAVLTPGEALAEDELAAALGPGPYAVRSSAPAEDGAARSWAGQLESVLGVEREGLRAAVARVRASGASARARAYGEAPDEIPVLVQRLVPARAGGVAFSLDPRDGDERHVVVEAVAGSPARVTDGVAAPERWRVPVDLGDRPGAAAREADGDAARAAARDGGPASQGPRALPPGPLQDAVSLVLDVAAWLGFPCDVEFAWDGERTWLLQARAITAAAWRPVPGEWSAANLRDTMPGVLTALSSSTILESDLSAAIDEALRVTGVIGPGERLGRAGRVYAHAYWRVDEIKERSLRLAGFVERVFDETVGINPAYAGDGRRAPTTPATLARSARAALGVWRLYRRRAAEPMRHAARAAREERARLALPWDELDLASLRRELAAARALHRETNLHSYLVSFLAEQAQEAVSQLLARAVSSLDPPPDDRLLLAGAGAVATAAPLRAIEELARRHAGDAGRLSGAATLDELPPDVRSRLEAAIAEHAWMASALDELAAPRWDEDPAAPLALFRGALRALASGEAGNARAARAIEREREERRVLAAAGIARPLVRRALELARRHQAAREEMRVATARVNRIVRRALLALGARLAERGALEAADDVFWLLEPELYALCDGGMPASAARAAAGARRRHAQRFRRWDPPTTLGGGAAEAPVAAVEEGRTLRGVGCSSGTARGPVAVLRAIDELDAVAPGAVLVVKYGNPGWAPAFALASALVVEEGGLLSHSSVIAREQGLPAVVSVARATDALRDGEVVEVDGRRGTVTLLERGDP